MLTCASCGNQEPDGSRFCGSCGASFAQPPDEGQAHTVAIAGSRPTWTCANCGHDEPEGARFCGTCGAPFAHVDDGAADTVALASSVTTLTCANCGHQEQEGSQFCGSCGAPFVTVDRPSASTDVPAPSFTDPSDQEPRPAPAPTGSHRVRWMAAGTGVVVLVAGGATAAVIALTGGDDSPEAASSEQVTLTQDSAETQPPASSATLVATVAPLLGDVAAAQSAVGVRVRSLTANTASRAALRNAADALAARIVRAQAVLGTVTPNGSAEAQTLSVLRPALAAHLAYAESIASLAARPDPFTETEAKAVIARAEQARRAYVELVAADAALPIVSIDSSEDSSLLAVVPAPKPTRRVIDLAPLLVGVSPNDPPGEGRCFGPYTARASLRVSGIVHRNDFVQCGDDAAGSPGRASGVYRFSGAALPSGSRLVRVTGQAAIDESSSSSQRGSAVTWRLFYDGTPICSVTVVWSGSRPRPAKLDCRATTGASPNGFDVRRLRIQQVASLASSGSFWAGLLGPKIVVEAPP